MTGPWTPLLLMERGVFASGEKPYSPEVSGVVGVKNEEKSLTSGFLGITGDYTL
jgi:hypothetical protein